MILSCVWLISSIAARVLISSSKGLGHGVIVHNCVLWAVVASGALGSASGSSASIGVVVFGLDGAVGASITLYWGHSGSVKALVPWWALNAVCLSSGTIVRHEEACWAVVLHASIAFLIDVTELSLFAEVVWSSGVVNIENGWLLYSGSLDTFVSRGAWGGGINCIGSDKGVLISVSAS